MLGEEFERLAGVLDRLRDPGGCPWDRKQTLDSLIAYLLEEAHEAAEAARVKDPALLKEELGDLLIQVIFMSRIAREKGWFSLAEVCKSAADKLIRRHPHVFGELKLDDAEEVLANWEKMKSEDRGGKASLLDGVPEGLPALLKAYRMTQKAAAVGFDWNSAGDVLPKLQEELNELDSAIRSRSHEEIEEELGDLLFSIANLARKLGVDPESALQKTNRKFKHRFQAMERAAKERGLKLDSLNIEQLDALWEEAKVEERGQHTEEGSAGQQSQTD